jgi:hypothetical protein
MKQGDRRNLGMDKVKREDTSKELVIFVFSRLRKSFPHNPNGHSGGSRNPGSFNIFWTPAFAGVTDFEFFRILLDPKPGST